MNKQLKQYEEEYMEYFEEKLDRGEYEKEYIKSKENLEGKILQKMKRSEAEEKKNHWRTVGKITAACVAAVLVTAVSVPDIRAVATDFLHSTLGLQIAGVKDDKKEEASKEEQGFSFEWLMQFTEKEYWEWSQAHELTGGELPSYVPEGFQEVKNDPNAYSYRYVEVLNFPWSGEKMDPKDPSTYGHFAVEKFPSILSKEEKKRLGNPNALCSSGSQEIPNEPAVLCGVSRTWKKGQQELWYNRELYDIFEMKEHDGVKEEAAKELTIGGDQAYLFQSNDGTWLYIFGETTLTKLYVKNEGLRYGEKWLVKMAESIQK